MSSFADIHRKLSRARSDPARVVHRLRDTCGNALSPHFTYLETNHDPKNTLLLISSQRSGSTWLAETLVSGDRSCRYIYEAFYNENSAPPLSGRYVSPETPDERLDARIGDLLSGRLRSRRTDQFNAARLAHHRLLKEVTATTLAPRISVKFPDVRILYLIRHPLAVASSLLRLGWGPLGLAVRQPELVDHYFRKQQDDLLRQEFLTNVYRWCVENSVPIRSLSRLSTHATFYEHVVLHPNRELQRIKAFLSERSHGWWRSWSPNLASLDRPSMTTYRPYESGPRTRIERSQWWINEIPSAWIDPAMRIVRMFGLEWIYGEGPMPLIDGQQLFAE